MIGAYFGRLLLPALLLAGAGSLHAHDALESTLLRMGKEITEHPDDYLERFERALLMLEHNMHREPVGEDIGILLSIPEWEAQGRRLKANHLYVQKRYKEAEALISRNSAEGGAAYDPQQPRFLAGIALHRRDTLGALKAYRSGWERFELQEDYISMVDLYKAHGDLPDPVLEEGLRRYPKSPGVYVVVYKAYMEGAKPARLKRALVLAEQGQAALWPMSADWKIRYARALIADGRSQEAEEPLLRALDLLDGDRRLRPDHPEFARVRREIFAMLEALGK